MEGVQVESWVPADRTVGATISRRWIIIVGDVDANDNVADNSLVPYR